MIILDGDIVIVAVFVAVDVLMVLVAAAEPVFIVFATIVMYCCPGAGAIRCGDFPDTGIMVIFVGDLMGEMANFWPGTSLVGVLGRADTSLVGDRRLP